VHRKINLRVEAEGKGEESSFESVVWNCGEETETEDIDPPRRRVWPPGKLYGLFRGSYTGGWGCGRFVLSPL
jgi:hypothetical protein